MRLHLSTCVLGDDGGATSLVREALEAAGCIHTDSEADGVVVVASLPPAARITELELETWIGSVEEPLARSLEHLQEARRRLAGGGGRIVLVAPTIGIAGAAELIGLTTVVEGIRAMAKSAARQWAAEGIIVNAVLLPLEVLRPSMAPLTTHLAPPVGASPDVASIGWMLATELQAPTALVGATVSLDGGSVMAP